MEAIVTVGLPGCGKSTFAATLGGGYVELNLDAFREAVSGDAADQQATGRAIWRRERALERHAAAGHDVIISDTHAKRRDRTRLVRRLRALGYRVRLVFFDVGEHTCLARNRMRARQVPESAIAQMARLIRNTPPTPDEADLFEVQLSPEDPLLRDDA